MPKSMYSAGDWQRYLVNEIQEPAKKVLSDLGNKRVTINTIRAGLRFLKGIENLPEPTCENMTDADSLNLIARRDEFFEHFSDGFAGYKQIYRPAINFGIIKLSFDALYKQMLNWWMGEMFKHGWELPGQNRPRSQLWHNIKPSIKTRLTDEIRKSYQILQDRLVKVEQDLGHSPEKVKQQTAIREEQFVQRILDAVEREVDTWKG